MKVSSQSAASRSINPSEREAMRARFNEVNSPVIQPLKQLNQAVFGGGKSLLLLPQYPNLLIKLIEDTSSLPLPTAINRKNVFANWYSPGLSITIESVKMNMWSGYLSKEAIPLVNKEGDFTPALNFSFPNIDKSLLIHPCLMHMGHTGLTDTKYGLQAERFGHNSAEFFLPSGEKISTPNLLLPSGQINNNYADSMALALTGQENELPKQLLDLERYVFLFLTEATQRLKQFQEAVPLISPK